MPWHKDNKVKKQLRFFYLLRDDIFENKDHTKFFDYIMPVVPVLDSSNSYNKVREYLENAGIFGQFDDHFLRGVSLYIDDLRVVKNIFNEFLIYNHKLNAIELDVNKLFHRMAVQASKRWPSKSTGMTRDGQTSLGTFSFTDSWKKEIRMDNQIILEGFSWDNDMNNTTNRIFKKDIVIGYTNAEMID